jgi:hypothetical protein
MLPRFRISKEAVKKNVTFLYYPTLPIWRKMCRD